MLFVGGMLLGLVLGAAIAWLLASVLARRVVNLLEALNISTLGAIARRSPTRVADEETATIAPTSPIPIPLIQRPSPSR